MKYHCLSQPEYRTNSFTLVTIRYADIQKIREWRNEQMDILRQSKPLSSEEQEEYWSRTISPSFANIRPKQILLSLIHHEHCIGYGGLTHIDWENKRAEISFLLETNQSKEHVFYRKALTSFLSLVKQIALGELHLHRLYTETFDIRPHLIAIIEECGFQFEGRMRDHVFLNGKFVDSLSHGCLL